MYQLVVGKDIDSVGPSALIVYGENRASKSAPVGLYMHMSWFRMASNINTPEYVAIR